MKTFLPAAKSKRLEGQQPFCDGQVKHNFNLSDFWSWSFSGLLNNVTRGHLAEFMVAKAIDAANGVREVWGAYDLLMPAPNGKKVKVEVKSASNLQEWEQDDVSSIQFNVRKTRAINHKTGLYTGIPKRHSDVYVFAHYKEEKDKDMAKTLNVHHWDFYVVPTASLNKRRRSQQSITLNSLKKEKVKLKVEVVNFSGLKDAVIKAAS